MRSLGYTPEPGDVIIFQSSGVVCHTGIVIGYDSSTMAVTAIEGKL